MFYILSITLSLENPVYLLYFQHILIWTSHVSMANLSDGTALIFAWINQSRTIIVMMIKHFSWPMCCLF